MRKNAAILIVFVVVILGANFYLLRENKSLKQHMQDSYYNLIDRKSELNQIITIDSLESQSCFVRLDSDIELVDIT